MTHTKNHYNTQVSKTHFDGSRKANQGTNQGRNVLQNVDVLKSQTMELHSRPGGSAMATQCADQEPTHIQITQIEKSIGGPSSAT